LRAAMICLIKQQGAEIVAWYIGPTLESVARQCADELLTKELLTVVRYTALGKYRLLGGKYTLLVGTGRIPERGLTIADISA